MVFTYIGEVYKVTVYINPSYCANGVAPLLLVVKLKPTPRELNSSHR